MSARRVPPRTCSIVCVAAGFAVVLLHCGGGPPPDPNLKPAGSGWYCWEEQGGPDRGCRRTAADCEANRERRLRFRGGVTFANCAQGPATAYCFSFFDKEFARTDYTCAPSASECSKVASTVADDAVLKVSIKDISGCAPWQ